MHTFGITDLALDWMTSYLSDRSFYVRWGNTSSSKLHVNTGVPQGSSLGPLCFSLYVAPLSRVLNSFGVKHHQYADDTQIYISASKSDLSDKVDVLQQCTVAVRHWLLSNGLQLNPSKSDVIQFVTARGRERVDDVTSIQASHSHTTIQPSCTLKSLGITLDKQLSFDQHIVDVCKACYISTSELYDTFASHCLMTSQQPLHAVSLAPDLITATLCSLGCRLPTLPSCRIHSHESCNAVPSTTTSRRLSSSFTGYRFNNV